MSITSAYVLHGIATPSDFISQITNARASPRVNVAVNMASGLPYALFPYNLSQMPEISFDSTQVKAILDATGVGLADISAGNTDLYFKLTTNKGIRVADATTSHVRMRAAEAVLIPQSISASNDAPATMSCRIACLYDGTNEPIVPAGGLALAGTPVSEDHFTLGPVTINASSVPGIQSVSIDFGLSIDEKIGDGEQFSSWLNVREQRPVITITTLTSAMVTYGLKGTALTGLSVWFRKCAQTARVANATAEHILFTATAGLITIDDASGGGNEHATTTIRIDVAAADATSAPLTLDTTAAIT